MASTAASNGKPFSHLEHLKSAFCLCVDSGVVVRAELTLLSQHMGDFSCLSTHLYQWAGISLLLLGEYRANPEGVKQGWDAAGWQKEIVQPGFAQLHPLHVLSLAASKTSPFPFPFSLSHFLG